MKRMGTLLKYVLWIVAFWILSDFLINVGINSTYKPIDCINKDSQIEVYQAEATLVGGRVKGVIHNTEQNDISNKFIKLQLFSSRDVELGTRYIEIGNVEPNGISPIELYYKIDNVKYYTMEIVDEKENIEDESIELLPHAMSKAEVIWGVILTLMLM